MKERLGVLADKRVLYAEDEAGIRENIAEILKLFFMDVVTVKDGLELLDEMALNRYDVLILDISMPRMDGLEAVKTLRDNHSDLPIIITSAHSTQEYLWRAVELKITKYLTKPHTRESLIGALEQAALELTGHRNQPVRLGENLHYSPCRKSLRTPEGERPLTLHESRLLEFLLQHLRCTVTFEEIGDYLWGYDLPSKEAIKSLVKELRKKIGKDRIRSVYGIGYLFDPEPDEKDPASSS
jgi:DNA-binding response OmpR family regulator